MYPNIVSEFDVRNVPEVKWTDTWHPIHHGRCIDVVENALAGIGEPSNRALYSLSKDGLNAYGKIILADYDQNISQTIIWRNSMNKSFSFGVCGGTHAWACTNLMMSSEFVEFRKHTKGMDDGELARVVGHGMEVILPYTRQLQTWHAAMAEVKLDPRRTKNLAYDAITSGVIARTKVNEFHNLLFGEEHEYDPKTLYGFHGAITQTMRDMRMTGGMVERQQNLFKFVNERFGDKLPMVKAVA